MFTIKKWIYYYYYYSFFQLVSVAWGDVNFTRIEQVKQFYGEFRLEQKSSKNAWYIEMQPRKKTGKFGIHVNSTPIKSTRSSTLKIIITIILCKLLYNYLYVIVISYRKIINGILTVTTKIYSQFIVIIK